MLFILQAGDEIQLQIVAADNFGGVEREVTLSFGEKTDTGMNFKLWAL